MKEEDLFDLTFDLTLAVIRKRGDGRITSIQPYESQGERTISIDYDEQQARISIIIHQNDSKYDAHLRLHLLCKLLSMFLMIK